MDQEVRRAALRAAAKIALFTTAATAFGCSSNVEPLENLDDPSVSGDEGSTDNSSDEMRKRKKRDAGKADASPTGNCSDTSANQFECCKAQLKATFPPDSGTQLPKPSDETKACCHVLASHYDQAARANNTNAWTWGDDSRVKWQCCSAIGWQGSATCTPWGPPVPPSMPKRRDVAHPLAEVA